MTCTAILLSVLLPVANAQVPTEVVEAPGAKEYPVDDALVVWQRIDVVADGSGDVVYKVDEALKMLTAYSTRHAFFDPRLSWNDAAYELTIDQARSWMVDGTEVVAKDNSKVPNTAGEMQWAVPYAYMREMTVSHVGVEHGGTSQLAYTLDERDGTPDLPFWGSIDLQGPFPIVEQHIHIEGPEGLKWAVVGGRGLLEVEADGTDGSVTIDRRDVASHNGAEGWPAPKLVWSSLESWAHVRKTLGSRITPALEADDRVRSQTHDLLEPGMLDEERVAVIHRFVVEGVRTIDWPVADFDYTVRPAGDVLDSSIGHSLDKAILLTSMLRTAGLDAEIVLASSGWMIAEDVPTPVQLDQVWVHTGGRMLDPTASRDVHNVYDLYGHYTFRLDGERGPEIFTGPHGDDAASVRIAATLQDLGYKITVSGSADIDLQSAYNPTVAWDRSADRVEGVAAGVAGSVGGARVDAAAPGRVDVSLCSLRADFSGGEFHFDDSGFVRVLVPRVPGAVRLGTWRQDREFPVRSRPGREVFIYELDLPGGFEPVWLPPPVTLENGAGKVVREVAYEDGVVTISETLELTATWIEPDEWGALRALLVEVERERDRLILLERTR